MKLLIIDDSTDITDVLAVFCQSQNIDYRTASTAAEGLDEIRNDNFDLILLDLAMPEVSGVDVINTLKNEGLLNRLNVVIFTASSDHKVIEQIRRVGVKEIFKKPCSLDDLTELIKKYDKSP